MELGMVGVGAGGFAAGLYGAGRMEQRASRFAAAGTELALANNRPGVPETSAFWERSANWLERGQFPRPTATRLGRAHLQSMVIEPLRAAAKLEPAAGYRQLTELTRAYDAAGVASARTASRLMVPTFVAAVAGLTGAAMLATQD